MNAPKICEINRKHFWNRGVKWKVKWQSNIVSSLVMKEKSFFISLELTKSKFIVCLSFNLFLKLSVDQLRQSWFWNKLHIWSLPFNLFWVRWQKHIFSWHLFGNKKGILLLISNFNNKLYNTMFDLQAAPPFSEWASEENMQRSSWIC